VFTPSRGHELAAADADDFTPRRQCINIRVAQLRTLAGGEVAGYTKLLTDSRNQARERMWREARTRSQRRRRHAL
jgi:Putative heavy-metal-binding